MNESCGCCEGTQTLTPRATTNRPGLDALAYRVGSYATFLETMMAQLSTTGITLSSGEIAAGGQPPAGETSFPLRVLTTRDLTDPALALLQGWATVADVLTFYQERIANEGFLRTATERRSVLELARLVGYALRPGVAASVYLAYTLEKDSAVLIPSGSRAQSVPGPGETAQSFETADNLAARAAWNNLQPRLTQPQWISQLNPEPLSVLRFKGQATNLRANDPLLFDFGSKQFLGFVADVALEPEADRTRATLQAPPWMAATAILGTNANMASAPATALMATLARGGDGVATTPYGVLAGALGQLELPPSVPPPNAFRLPRSLDQTYARQTDTAAQLLVRMNPRLETTLYSALQNAVVAPASDLQDVQVMHVKAAPFGHNAPLKPVLDGTGRVIDHIEWPLTDALQVGIQIGTSSFVAFATASATTGGLLAIVSITQNGTTSSRPVTLLPGSTTPTSISVGGVGVDVSVPSSTSFPAVFKFNLPQATELRLNINKNKALVVTLNGVVLQVVSGETLREVTQGGLVTIEYTAAVGDSQELISIVAERPSAMPNPLVVALDGQYDKIVPESWVVIERTDISPVARFFYQVSTTRTASRAAFGITGKVTELTLKPFQNPNWLVDSDHSLAVYRNTTLYAQGELLTLAEEPVPDQGPDGSPGKVRDREIELDGLYAGLDAGRWLVVRGERADIPGTNRVMGSELVMLAAVRQDVQKVHMLGAAAATDRPGDKTHTFMTLAQQLQYAYKLPTVTINGNVVGATHGETRNEVLGSGDGSRSTQSFTLHQPPLTYLSAPSASGAASTLQVRVNDLLWHEADSLAGLEPTDRRYVTSTADDGKTTVIFGNGEAGARLPTGSQNVKALYRNGIGRPGNVRAEQISLLASRPLGVKEVLNPLAATGGADAESRDQARRNVPLAVMALDRLVSVTDYADFARTFAGIGKASAQRLPDGRRQVVHLTVGGPVNIPINESSDLLHNLRSALRNNGDPYQPLQVTVVVVDLIVIKAEVQLLHDYVWEAVAPKLRATLLDTLSYERRDLGQHVLLSEVISALHAIAGVDYVELEILDTLNERSIQATLAQNKDLASQLSLRERIPVQLAGPLYHTVVAGDTLASLQLLYAIDDMAAVQLLNPLVPFQEPLPDGLRLLIRRLEPAHIAFLNPDVADTLILTERKDG